MNLPSDFQFSQASLQDYVDCPQRFYLRYVRRLAWPAEEAEPALENERHLRLGAEFHRMAHQHGLGLPADRLLGAPADADLARWWRNYVDLGLSDLPALRYPEIVLSAPLGGYRLLAKYDLVAVEVGAVDAGRRAVIVDWKTSRKRPRREWLAETLQTRVYPYLLVRAGLDIAGGQPLQPEQVEMIYWFANFPREPERFAYDAAGYEADDTYLTGLVQEIAGLDEDSFVRTAHERSCVYCPYRSFCQRDTPAGPFDETENDPDIDDFSAVPDVEQIAEVAYR